jgi:hypothetical protein
MKIVHVAAIASLLLAAPVVAQTTTAPKPPAKTAPAPKPAATAAVHATKGVVKSVDATTLVITKTAGKGPETTFVLNASTQKQGDISVGSSVDVRYHAEGKSKVATAVSVAKAGASKAKAAK